QASPPLSNVATIEGDSRCLAAREAPTNIWRGDVVGVNPGIPASATASHSSTAEWTRSGRRGFTRFILPMPLPSVGGQVRDHAFDPSPYYKRPYSCTTERRIQN